MNKDGIIKVGSRLSGFHIRLKEIHFSAETLDLHNTVGDFISEFLEFEDEILEQLMSIGDVIKVGELTAELPKAVNFEDLLTELSKHALGLVKSLEASKEVGAKVVVEDFLVVIGKFKYLSKIVG